MLIIAWIMHVLNPVTDLVNDHPTACATAVALQAVFALTVLGCMMPGWRQHQPVGAADAKKPPVWSPEMTQQYPFRSWVSDLVLWSVATEVEVARQGPAVALAVVGSAREVVRELLERPQGLEHLRNGAQDQDGNRVSGLMMLIQELATRYAPLEAETTTRAMFDLMSFTRVRGEGIDAHLTRFEIIRNRAEARGGLGMNTQGQSWILLRSLHLNSDQWDRVLSDFRGNMPQNNREFATMVERLRRMGHFSEPSGVNQVHFGQAADGDGGMPTPAQQAMAFPVFAAGIPPPPPPHAVGGSALSFLAGRQGGGPPPLIESDHEDSCRACGSYFDEEFSSGDTSEDDEMPDIEGQQAYATLPVGNPHDSNDLGNALYQDYYKAKKRWRRFTGKPPRRFRKTNFKRNSRYGSKFGGSYAGFLPQGSLAAHRGPGGKGKGKGSRTNPRGRDGKVLECSICKSTEHLWRNCPNNKGGGPPQPVMFGQASASASPGTPVFAEAASQVLSSNSAVPGMSFYSKPASADVGIPRDTAEYFNMSTGSSPRDSKTSVDDLLGSLGSFGKATPAEPQAQPSDHTAGYHSSAAGSSQSRPAKGSSDTSIGALLQFGGVKRPAETVDGASTFQRTIGMSDTTIANKSIFVSSGWPKHAGADLASGIKSSISAMFAPPSRPAPALVDAAVPPVPPHVAGADPMLTALLGEYRRDEPNRATPDGPAVAASNLCARCQAFTPMDARFCKNCGHAVLAALQDGTSHFPWWECEGAAGAYHLRTRLPGNEVGLLVDPGAHDNLVGANTMARMVEIAQQKGFGSLVRPLATTMQVEGVGKGAQATDTATQVQIGIEGKLGTYTAPTIPDSDLPPLLGLKTLRTYRAILDMSGPEAELILPGPGGFELKLSPGSTRLPLTASASGHLILPVTNYPKPGDGQDSSFTFVSERTAPASRQ